MPTRRSPTSFVSPLRVDCLLCGTHFFSIVSHTHLKRVGQRSLASEE